MQVTNNQVNSLNKEKIKAATNATHTATVTMIALGFRQRAHTHTSLSAIKNQLARMQEKVNEKDFMEFWKDLENAGAGALILGRRGKQTRFEWNYSLRQIAQLAIEGKEDELKRFELKAKALETETIEKPKAIEVPKKATYKTSDAKIFSAKVRGGGTAQVILSGEVTPQAMEKLRECFEN